MNFGLFLSMSQCAERGMIVRMLKREDAPFGDGARGMDYHEIALCCEDASWDNFVQQHHAAHVLQTSAWGELKSQFGWSAAQIGLSASASDNGRDDNRLTQGGLILFRSLIPTQLARLVPLRTQIAYIPKGPLVEWHDQTATAEFLRQAEATCPQRTDCAAPEYHYFEHWR